MLDQMAPTLAEQLYVACETGDLKRVNQLLQKGVSPNFVSTGLGCTPLFAASREGHADVVRSLLEAGADVEKRSLRKCTALMGAAEKGFADVVTILLDYGAKAALTDEEGRSCLHYSTLSSDVGVVTMLVDRFPQLKETPDNFGKTPLLFSSSRLNVRSVRSLLDIGCDVLAVDKKGNTGVMLAIKALRPQASRKKQAAALEVVFVLIDAGADVSARNATTGDTALSVAAYTGQLKLIKLLRESGASPSTVDDCGFSPLMKYLASTRRKPWHGVRVFKSALSQTPEKQDALEAAREESTAEAVELLFCEGKGRLTPIVNNKSGSSVLHYAADAFWLGQRAWKQLLRECQGFVNVSNRDGRTPLQIALSRPVYFQGDGAVAELVGAGAVILPEDVLSADRVVTGVGKSSLGRAYILQQVIALCSGRHERLGRSSLLRILSDDCFSLIIKHVLQQLNSSLPFGTGERVIVQIPSDVQDGLLERERSALLSKFTR